jgi:signal transduction histidine kinase
MLREFLSENREELIERCRFKVRMRRAPRATPRELSHGVPLFLDQLLEVFPHEARLDEGKDPAHTDHDIAVAAARHGQELASHDFTIEQVVHDYGDLCQSITELAVERAAPITVREFGSLNNTLDKAIASAVASYSAQHEAQFADVGQLDAKERLGVLANAMRNLLNTAILAASAMKRGSVGLSGATAAALDRSLMAMRGLIDRTLADVRLDTSPMETAEVIEVGPFIAEVQLAAAFEATSTQCDLTVVVEPDIFMKGDRHLLSSAVANLLHCGVTSTQRNGDVFLTARARNGRVIIDVEDACTDQAPEALREMIERFERRDGGKSSSLGAALESARNAVEANSGTLSAATVPGKGCLYTIDVPEGR